MPDVVDTMMQARARVLHDLDVRGIADAAVVSVLEEALRERAWWLEQWPDGAEFIPGLVAQDVQDTLMDTWGRWPACTACDLAVEHPLSIDPPLGEDPYWVCDETGVVAAPLGALV